MNEQRLSFPLSALLQSELGKQKPSALRAETQKTDKDSRAEKVGNSYACLSTSRNHTEELRKIRKVMNLESDNYHLPDLWSQLGQRGVTLFLLFQSPPLD